MPLREFKDQRGVRWSVWEVRPTLRSEIVDALGNPRVRPEFMDGWLAFECVAEKRRYAPVPPEWEDFEDFRLERLCALGEPVERSRRLID